MQRLNDYVSGNSWDLMGQRFKYLIIPEDKEDGNKSPQPCYPSRGLFIIMLDLTSH